MVGVIGDPEASRFAYLSLYALQHRGQEACGIISIDDDKKFLSHKSFGLVGEIFSKDQLDALHGTQAIGHNRYATHGGRSVQNIQPFSFNTSIGPLAIAHNGNLTNSTRLRRELEAQGSIFQSTSDTEVFMHLLAKGSSDDLQERIVEAMSKVQGAYSLALMGLGVLFAIRDPYGFRPLVIGKRKNAYIVVSETCALDLIDAELVREVEPGEVVKITPQGIESSLIVGGKKERSAFCSFESIYFSRPDSKVYGQHVYGVRKKLGEELALEDNVDADVVIAVPDSGVPMAIGYAAKAQLPFEVGLVRNHYVGRTFIEPNQAIRDFGVKLKLNPIRDVLYDKRVLVVDDSIVRGTTSTKIVRMIRNAGAKEVHMRIASPPITHSCYFGVDTPQRENLLAAQYHIKEMCEFIGADSLAFLSTEGLKKVLEDQSEQKYCMGCFGQGYLEAVNDEIKEQPTDQADGPGLRYP